MEIVMFLMKTFIFKFSLLRKLQFVDKNPNIITMWSSYFQSYFFACLFKGLGVKGRRGKAKQWLRWSDWGEKDKPRSRLRSWYRQASGRKERERGRKFRRIKGKNGSNWQPWHFNHKRIIEWQLEFIAGHCLLRK